MLFYILYYCYIYVYSFFLKKQCIFIYEFYISTNVWLCMTICGYILHFVLTVRSLFFIYLYIQYQDYIQGGCQPPFSRRNLRHIYERPPPHVLKNTERTYLWMRIILVESVVVLRTFRALLQDKWEGTVIVMSPLLYVHMLFLVSCIIRYYLSFPWKM